MREEAKWFLAIIREANRQAVSLSPQFYGVIMAVFLPTDEEMTEIGEILKDDLREKTSQSPIYEAIREKLARMGPQNPWGE